MTNKVFEEMTKSYEKCRKIVEKEYNLTEDDGEKYWKLVTGTYKKSGGEIHHEKTNENPIHKILNSLHESKMINEQVTIQKGDKIKIIDDCKISWAGGYKNRIYFISDVRIVDGRNIQIWVENSRYYFPIDKNGKYEDELLLELVDLAEEEK